MAGVSWLPSQRGGRVLIHDHRGYTVTKKREYEAFVDLEAFGDGGINVPMRAENLICTNRNNSEYPCKCTAKVRHNVLNDTYEDFEVIGAHADGCTWDENNVRIEIMKDRLYQKLRDKVYNNIPDAWAWAYHELEQQTPGLGQHFPMADSFRKKGMRVLNGNVPKLPKTAIDLDGIIIPERLQVTLHGQPFLLLQHTFNHTGDLTHPGGSRETIWVFGTWERFRKMCEAQTAFADGTFKTCPHPFYQVYIIHVVHENGVRMRPCIWCLLTRKTGEIYTVLFQKLRELAQEREHPIVWTKFRTDFEVAVMNAVIQMFPGVTVTGCFFHFCSAIIKKLREMGFNADYKNALTRVKVAVKSIMGLAYLPPMVVADTFQAIRNEYQNLNVQRPNLDDFFAYVEESWVQGGVAAVERWTIGNLNSKRTNNDLEGYHSRMLTKFGNHPNAWKFIELLQKEEQDIRIELQHLENGALPHVAPKILEREENVRILKQRYADLLITPQQFAKQVGFLTSVSD